MINLPTPDAAAKIAAFLADHLNPPHFRGQ